MGLASAMSLNELDGLLGVTPRKNRTYTICAMCSEKKDYKSLYEELLIKYEYQNEVMVEFMKGDSCNDLLIEKEWKHAIKHLHKPYHPEIVHFIFDLKNDYPQTYMITLTFDPKKFKRLINRNAQRAYMEQTINELINIPGVGIDEIYGCYELHENGNVHVHFLTQKIYDNVLEFLKYKFTDKKENIHAVHCCTKNFYEAVEYINKPETKDKNCDYNFFVWQKMSRNLKQNSDLKIKSLL